mgnify:CR=1 FL=1|jgi:two-component system cell cycle response regulator DivK
MGVEANALTDKGSLPPRGEGQGGGHVFETERNISLEGEEVDMKTIILIEDDASSARLVRRALERYDYQLLHAKDGERGLRIAQERQPDLILLDLGLPDVEGQTLAAMIKGMPELASIPLVAVTAWPAYTAERMARAYGCDGYISKPISPRDFPAQIAVYLGVETDEQPQT